MASSLLSVGQRCCTPHCNVVDFLPILCPTCERTFCSSHIHGQDHECFQSSSQTKTTSRDFVVAAKCHLEGCDAVTMEAAGLTRRSDVEVAPIGREVRCFGCQEAFCARCARCPSVVVIDSDNLLIAIVIRKHITALLQHILKLTNRPWLSAKKLQGTTFEPFFPIMK